MYESTREKINKSNRALNEYNYEILSLLCDLSSTIHSVDTHLARAKKKFADGAWCISGIPLANEEFKKCQSCISSAKTNVDEISNEL